MSKQILNILELKNRSTKDLESSVKELKEAMNPNSYSYDSVLHLLGRLEDINNPDKLYEILKATAKNKEEREKDLQGKVLEFYSLIKNQARASFLNLINEISQEDLKENIILE